MADATVDRELVVGRINGCYGIKGWVKIHAFTEPPERLLDYRQCQLRRRSGRQVVEFDQGRRQGKGLIAHIKGIDDRTTAETLRGAEIVIDASALPDLPQDDYYWHELEQLAVWHVGDESPVLLGQVKHLMETGANDVVVVSPSEGSVDDQERLIPYLFGEVVREVDLDAGTMKVDWPADF